MIISQSLRTQAYGRCERISQLDLGGVVPQDKSTGYRFEVRMTLQNTGNTPAYKVRSATRIDIFPFPLPGDFVLPKLSLAQLF